MGPSVTLDLYARASGRGVENRTRDEAECSIFSTETWSQCGQIQCYTKDPCINYFVMCLKRETITPFTWSTRAQRWKWQRVATSSTRRKKTNHQRRNGDFLCQERAKRRRKTLRIGSALPMKRKWKLLVKVSYLIIPPRTIDGQRTTSFNGWRRGKLLTILFRKTCCLAMIQQSFANGCLASCWKLTRNLANHIPPHPFTCCFVACFV